MQIVRPQSEGARDAHAVLVQKRVYGGENVAGDFHAGIQHDDRSPQTLLQDDVLGGGFPQVMVGVNDADARIGRRQLVKPFAGFVRGAVVEHHRLDIALARPLQRAGRHPLHVVRVVARDYSDCEIKRARRVYQRRRFGGGRNHVARFGQLFPLRFGADAGSPSEILNHVARRFQAVADAVGGGVFAHVAQMGALEQLLQRLRRRRVLVAHREQIQAQRLVKTLYQRQLCGGGQIG